MWLLFIYPLKWRERYGDEMVELLRDQSWSPSLVIDLVAGAIDARLNPRLGISTDKNEHPPAMEKRAMIAKALGCRCAGYGPDLTAREKRKSILLMLGSTLALTAVWMWMAATYSEPQVSQYVLAFVQVPLFAGLIIAMPLRSLKGRRLATKAIIMSTCFFALIAWCVLVGFIATTF